MKHLNNFDQHINEESNFIKTIALSALLSLGLSKADAQSLSNKSSQQELSVIDSLIKQNNAPQSLKDLKIALSNKVEDPDKFVLDNLKIESDKTVKVVPSFLSNLGVSLNRKYKTYSISYKIDLGK
jgi:hypothetical protein